MCFAVLFSYYFFASNGSMLIVSAKLLCRVPAVICQIIISWHIAFSTKALMITSMINNWTKLLLLGSSQSIQGIVTCVKNNAKNNRSWSCLAEGMHNPQSCFLFPCHAFLLDLWIETLRRSFPGQLLISTVVPSFPSHCRKDRRISLRIGTIYKINIKPGLHFARVTSHENSSSCIFVEHPPPVSINCTLLSRNKIQSTRDFAARCSCLSVGK